MKKLYFAIIITAILWAIMFSPWTAPHLNFWIAMTCSALILTGMSVSMTPDFKKQWPLSLKEIFLGVASAAVLWGIFWTGDKLSSLLFSFAKPEVNLIYGMKTGYNTLIIALLLITIIGPAEEIFWRGFVQRRFTTKYGAVIAFFTTTIIYALVHIWSFNLMLIAAAAVCGGFWGLMYAWRKNLTAVVVSHALWDVAVFILFPI
jgi:membrane protease YdiL (CAAX protease family)